ncbi:Hypothetical predicted protein [Paramuricea clavata]|uniref:Uncharacterized protein n=1 Tax=Paramuricea clavata TaxID=317549 RepID=A0A6S7JRG2_PARCT|nr:Hypothetical predicted protein [Paramuricea clavata]
MRCVCCGKFSAHNYVRLFGETAIKENIKEAIEKYGGITVSQDVVAKSSACVCKSCFILAKGINDRVKKLSLLCRAAGKSSNQITDATAGKRTYQQQKSPSDKTFSPSVFLNRPKRIAIRPSISAARNPVDAETSECRGSLLDRFTATAATDTSASASARKKETRSHEILRNAGLRSAKPKVK